VPAPTITVFGSAAPIPGSPAYQCAFELGQAIAQAGWTVCNGGYSGIMEASARGARQEGGHTVGVTCDILPMRREANPYIAEEIRARDLHTRLNTLVARAHGFVVLPGGTGTLLELALVWELCNKRLIDRDIPLVLLGDHWLPLVPIIRAAQPEACELATGATVDEVMTYLRAHVHEAVPAPRAPASHPDESPSVDP
jgi:uncharacterized protein (TIGR00730 family)